jgi:hypothetical protein
MWESTNGKRSNLPFKKGLLLWSLVIGAHLLYPVASAAQDLYEIQVYPSETIEAGRTMIELHSNMALRGTTQRTEGVLPTEHALHETVEITHGFTSWLDIGLYTFLSIQPGMNWQWGGDSIRPRVRIPEDWHWPIGVGFLVAVSYQQRNFSTDTWTLELLPIIDKQWGPWYLSFNPGLGRSLRGESTNRGFEFDPSFKIKYDLTHKIGVGIEYYGSLGPLQGFDPWQKQWQQIFPAIDLSLADWEFNFGVGFGLTEATDRLVVKMILGCRF